MACGAGCITQNALENLAGFESIRECLIPVAESWKSTERLGSLVAVQLRELDAGQLSCILMLPAS